MTKSPNLSTLHPPLQCPLLCSLHAKLRKAHLQLSTSRSKGPDTISAIVQKCCAPELAPILSILQLSFTFGMFPSSWKLAYIFPILRKGTKLTLKTIAPLQLLLSSLGLWRLFSLNNCLPSFETNNLLSDHQHDLTSRIYW